MIAFSTVLIEYEIFNPEKVTTKIAMSRLELVYCISNI